MPIYFHYRDSLQKKQPQDQKQNQNNKKIRPKERKQLVYCIDVLPGNPIVVVVSKSPAPWLMSYSP